MNSVFAARLTKLRRERGMSQKDAAKCSVCRSRSCRTMKGYKGVQP